jgi:hypothetical protein
MSKKKRLSRSKAEAQAAAETLRYMEMFLNDNRATPGTNEAKEPRGNG